LTVSYNTLTSVFLTYSTSVLLIYRILATLQECVTSPSCCRCTVRRHRLSTSCAACW